MQQEQKIPFTSHLEELRKRLMISIAAVVTFSALAYAFSDKLFMILAKPLPPNTNFAFIRLVEPFFTYLKVSLLTGIFLSSPVLIYQIWAFIAPGLHENERKWVWPIVISSVFLFIGGVLFCYFIVLPVGFPFFLSFATDTIRPMLSMDEYFSFITKFLLAFGIVFEIPLFILFLSLLGIVDAKMLSAYRKYAILGIFIIAAILTPTPDAFSQLLMAGPMMLLYEIGIIVARVFGKKATDETAEPA